MTTGIVRSHSTNIHFHGNGLEVVAAAAARARNTTIAIGADQKDGILLLDIDVQGEVCRDQTELREQLLMIAEALEATSPFDDVEQA